jgi:hypothetical protein
MKIFNYNLPEGYELIAVLLAIVVVWYIVDLYMEVRHGDSKNENK